MKLGRSGVVMAAMSAVVAGLEAACLALVPPVLAAFRAASAETLWRGALLLAGVIVLRAGAGYALDMLGVRLHLRVLLSIRERLARGFYAARYRDVEHLGPGRIVNLFSVQAERVASALSAVVALGGALMLVAVYLVMMASLSWRLGLGAVLILSAGTVIAWMVRRRVAAAAVAMVRADEDASAVVSDDAGGHAVVRAMGTPAGRLDLHRAANRAVLDSTLALHRWRHALRPLSEVANALILLGALGVALAVSPERLFASSTLILAFAVVLARFQGQLSVVFDSLAALAEHQGAASSVFSFISEPAADEPAPAASRSRSARLQAEGVSFSYRPGEPVLDEVDLRLARGEIVAVVGESGAGKSTLAHVLLRLQAPDRGSVTLDGDIGVVFEDAFVFDESVEWNVTLGRTISDEDVRDALEAAGADFVDGLPAGRASRVGPRGVALSAGQRQRIALARALAGGPAILVLDEATSGLDAQTESRILETLQETRDQRLALIIAHRLSTVLAADRIVVLSGGRVVATGIHADLLQTSDIYRQLVETQLAFV